jgi:hypothetical protein
MPGRKKHESATASSHLEGQGGQVRKGWTYAQKRSGPVAIGLVGRRCLRRSRRGNLERRSSNRIAHNRDGSASGADSRKVNFDDCVVGRRESWIFA